MVEMIRRGALPTPSEVMPRLRAAAAEAHSTQALKIARERLTEAFDIVRSIDAYPKACP